jgi:phosphatidylglycerophosphatase A
MSVLTMNFPVRAQTSLEGFMSLPALIGAIYNLLFPVAIVYGVLEIIIAGYKIMTSEGEPRKLDDAKAHLTDSIVGILFVMLAVTILRIIIKTFLGQDLGV